MAYNLVLNNSNLIGSSNNTYKYNFINGSLNIPEDSEIAVSQITIPYSWFNISSQYGNNTMSYYIPNSSNVQTRYDLIIPNGFYTTTDLNNFLQSQLKNNGHYWYSTQGATYSQQIQFVGSITGTTLQISQASSAQVQVYIGYVISYIPIGSTSYSTVTILSYNNTAGSYTLKESVPTATSNVAMTAQTNSEITPIIIYPLTIQTYTPQYTNQIISLTIPTAANIINIFGSNFVNGNGLNGTITWAGGYPTSGTQCAYLVIPNTNINTTTIGNLLGFSSGSYPSTSSSLTVLSQTINGNSLSASPPFPPNGSSVNGVIVRCNLVENDVTMPSDILDNFPITSTFGSNINYLPISNNAMKLKKGRHSSIIITFNDQNFNPLLMNDSNVLISLMIYYKKK
jgi:hypothetical protein